MPKKRGRGRRNTYTAVTSAVGGVCVRYLEIIVEDEKGKVEI